MCCSGFVWVMVGVVCGFCGGCVLVWIYVWRFDGV